MILIKPGVRFDIIAPAGARLLSAIDSVSRIYNPLWITSACDDEHSGLDDPHHSGNAYDVRSHDFDAATKQTVLIHIMFALDEGEPIAADGGYVTEHFFGWLENTGTDGEHFHFQLRHGSTLAA